MASSNIVMEMQGSEECYDRECYDRECYDEEYKVYSYTCFRRSRARIISNMYI